VIADPLCELVFIVMHFDEPCDGIVRNLTIGTGRTMRQHHPDGVNPCVVERADQRQLDLPVNDN
jgi:hypothetical protein